ncbi:MAG: DUF2335 domain-containing protein [bacterium]|nr:DUF2335 domain-containing protein [bacterium]
MIFPLAQFPVVNEELDSPPEESGEIELSEIAQLVASVASRAASEVIATQIREFYSEWSGPVPAPEDLQAFDNIQPGFAERIMVLAENRADHLAKSQMRELDIQEQGIAAQDRANEMNRDMAARAIDSHTITTLFFLVASVMVAVMVGAWPGVTLGVVPLSRYLFMFIQEARGRLGGAGN